MNELVQLTTQDVSKAIPVTNSKNTRRGYSFESFYKLKAVMGRR